MTEKSEKLIESEIAIAFNRGGTRLFKNVVGNLWTGKLLGFEGGIARLIGAIRIKVGIGGVGGSDRLGFHQIIITPEMVGKKIAVIFCAEVKTCGGKATKEQEHWISFINNMGGIAGIVRSVEETQILLDSYIKTLQS